MLLIFSLQSSPRLQYICKFIFGEIYGLPYSITIDDKGFESYEGPKINYSQLSFPGAYHILPHTLLFEKGILPQSPDCTCENETITFFNTPGADHSFDIFAASFYLISRYEEYLPNAKDMYGRYAHENSLAHKEGFLHIPLINFWLNSFKESLSAHFPVLKFKSEKFHFIPTYDIDIAWSYREKGILRNAAGFLKKPSAERIKTLFGKQKDPYDSYDFLNNVHAENTLNPRYFFLVAKQTGIYDKNILPANKAMQQLIKRHANKYNVGLHPSWKSNDEMKILLDEKNNLEVISDTDISTSRQHYIKFHLPGTYQDLIKCGITDDYSMGYGSINGFRASVATSFLWYDISEEKTTSLRIHPFCFMDANCFYEQKLTLAESYKELLHFYQTCRKVNGTLITIFHNNFFGTDKEFSGWKELYEKFIAQLPQ